MMHIMSDVYNEANKEKPMTDREKLIELLSSYFGIGDSYAYNLTRVKSAFAVGTMSLEDFEEFDDDTVADIADHLLSHGVTLCGKEKLHEMYQQGKFEGAYEASAKWIPVEERLPEKTTRCLVVRWDYVTKKQFIDILWFEKGTWWNRLHTGDYAVTHWMEMPEPPEMKGEKT